MKRYELINMLIDEFKYQNYLEIGLDAGITFQKVECKNKTSVDPAKGYYIHARPTHKCTSDHFFTHIAPKLNQTFDIVFIDGLHEHKQVMRDIENSLSFLKKEGSIVLHDCNPLTENAQKYPRPKNTYEKIWNGNVWKAIVDYRTKHNNCLVVDSDHGLGLINDNIVSDLITDDLATLDYKKFSKNRAYYLNLHSVKQLMHLMKFNKGKKVRGSV